MSAGPSRRGAGSAWAKLIKDEQMDDISFATVCKDRGLEDRGIEQYLTRRVGAGSRKRKREDDETDKANEDEKKTENQQTVTQFETGKPPKPYNLRWDEEEKAKKMKSKETEENNVVKNTTMKRPNPSQKTENNCVPAPPAPIPADEGANVPSRAVVSYDDLDPFN